MRFLMFFFMIIFCFFFLKLGLLKSKHTSGQAIHALRKDEFSDKQPKAAVLNGNICYRFIHLPPWSCVLPVKSILLWLPIQTKLNIFFFFWHVITVISGIPLQIRWLLRTVMFAAEWHPRRQPLAASFMEPLTWLSLHDLCFPY